MQIASKRNVGRLLLWAALAGMAGARQEQAPAWQAWKGAPSLQTKAPEAFQQKIAEDREWLAQLRLQLMTGRPPEGSDWQERLGEARLHATSVIGFLAQKELMVEAALTRAQALAALGRLDEARAAVEEVLLAPSDPLVAANRQHCVNAPPVLLAMAEAALKDPALEQERRQLGAGARQAAQEDQGLDARLRQAVADRNFDLLKQVGARTAPALEEALAADLDRLPEKDDLFSFLIDVNEPRAAAFALAHLDAGQAFRLRVVRGMENNKVFSRTVPLPEWPLLLTGLLRYPDSAGDSLVLVAAMIQANGLTPEVSAALIDALKRSGGDLTSELHRLLASSRTADSARSLYEFMVANGDASVRVKAAWQLRSLGDIGALLGRAADPDPSVRMVVARAIGGDENQPPSPSTDDASVAALRSLLADSAVEVRRPAASTLMALPRALEPELYRAAARDPDAGVRSKAAWVNHPDDALVSEILLALVKDPDPLVRKQVDNRLANPGERMRPHALLPAASVRLADPTWSGKERAGLIRRLVGSDEGLQALFSVATAHPEGTLLAAVLEDVEYFNASTGPRMRALLALDDGALARSFAQAHGVSRSLSGELEEAIGRANPPRWGVARAVLADAAAPPEVRLRAAALAAPGGGEDFCTALLALLASEPLRSRELSQDEVQALERALDALPDEDHNPLVAAALENPALQDRVRAQVAGSFEPRGPLARELTLGILARWAGAEDDRAAQAVRTALFNLRRLPNDVDPGLLERALLHPSYAAPALETMAALQDARYLPSFEAAMGADWVRESNTKAQLQIQAAAALTSFPGDEATEILLRAAASGSERARGLALEALSARRAVEEQRRLWEDSKQGRLERSDALQRLMAQLRDKDAVIRAQAARALGTLGALETMPALIDLLKDADPGVRKAAGEALERLNALPARGG